jgi:hypothetical protein
MLRSCDARRESSCNVDDFTIKHARRWAESYFRFDDEVEQFIAWLTSRDADTLAYYEREGWQKAARDFETRHKR